MFWPKLSFISAQDIAGHVFTGKSDLPICWPKGEIILSLNIKTG